MSASIPGSFKQMLEQSTEPEDILVPPGLTGDVLLTLAHVLGEKGYKLPADYTRFLREANGMVWNGVQMFGLPGSCAVSSVDLLSAKSALDPESRIADGRLLVGMCESFVYVHDPETDGYERYHKRILTKDETSYGDLSDLLRSLFAERQASVRINRPLAGAVVN